MGLDIEQCIAIVRQSTEEVSASTHRLELLITNSREPLDVVCVEITGPSYQVEYRPKVIRIKRKVVVNRYVRVKSKATKRKELLRDALVGKYKFHELEDKLYETGLTGGGVAVYTSKYKQKILNYAKQNAYSGCRFKRYIKKLGFKNIKEFTAPYVPTQKQSQ